jgi:LysM repeat protein
MRYEIQRGDTLRRIADRFGTSVGRLHSANRHIQNPNVTLEPQSICIPSWATYVAQKGETLSSIAKRFGTTETTLAAANSDILNTDFDVPLADQRLAVPFSGIHTVEKGDTLSELASRFGIAWDTLWEANCDVLEGPTSMFPGQLLAVPADSVVP